MRIQQGSIKDTHNGGFLHKLRDQDKWPLRSFATPKRSAEAERASIAKRHAVYSSLLESLPLAGRHATDLNERRGLSDTTIARHLYATVPEPDRQIEIAKLLAVAHDLSGVPGFYCRHSHWRMTCVPAGFFVPVRNKAGQIEAMQIRRDCGEPRYVWFSSAGKPQGVSSGSPLHHAHIWRISSTQTVILTEGPLKADIIADIIDAATIGAAGVSNFGADIGANLRRRFPALRQCLIAFDEDEHDRTRNNVESARKILIERLQSAGLRCSLLHWNGAKGLDDYLREKKVL
ncbi:MAG: DUF3854 domain-containing protein [Acidobacteria bacterium]|nr:DUF3854 domain-containing protein [Acidobacteriota bacterium]